MEGVRREDRGVRSLHASLSVDCQVHGAGMLTRSTGGKLHPRSRHATRSTESQTNFGDGHARIMWKLCWLAPTQRATDNMHGWVDVELEGWCWGAMLEFVFAQQTGQSQQNTNVTPIC